MSKAVPQREHKLLGNHLRNFTYSVDIKRFSRERGNMTPLNNNQGYFKKNREGSHQKIRRSQPASLGIKFSKNISQKNMGGKRKLSSGFQMVKSQHHSVSMDQHLLKEKYIAVKEMFEQERYEQVIPLARQIIGHFQQSASQRNLYYWITVALIRRGKQEQAIEEMAECLHYYPQFQEGHIFLGHLFLKKKNYTQAANSYQAAISCNSKVSVGYIQLARFYQQIKESRKAVDLLVKVINQFYKQGQFLSLLVQCLISIQESRQCEEIMSKYKKYYEMKDSNWLYMKGLIQLFRQNETEAYILFDQALKYNSSKTAVRKALMETIKIQINKRDFYKAYHSIGRLKFLQLDQNQELQLYKIFVEGVMTLMKKKSEEALQILKKISNNPKCKEMGIQGLIHKYQGYGHFKLSQYAQAIKCYLKISQEEKDECSQYNQLLAQGIQLSDTEHKFEQAIARFKQAKLVYPQKVQPYIYIAMTLILKFNLSKVKDEAKKAEVIIEALKQMQLGSNLNPNSSNLLYHRTILHLYFEDWEQAHSDINRCIEKAQQNLPKYFYLRGVCYSCIKDFKKAINQYSICLSLDTNYSAAYLQKAKCYFLLGNTQKGFGSLKLFMQLNPDDITIYKWIGDLLYEGTSYQDALKAYKELEGEPQDFDCKVMKIKCMIRTSPLNQIANQLKNLQKMSNNNQSKVQVDSCAFALLVALSKHESVKSLGHLVKRLNNFLQQNMVGCIFQLIDCMNLLGVVSFYLQKYTDAYESFVLVLELYQSLSEKQMFCLQTQNKTEYPDLDIEDIYYNIVLCELAQGNIKESIKMLKNQYQDLLTDQLKKKQLFNLAQVLEKGETEFIQWEKKNDRPFNYKFKRIQLKIGKIKMKTKPAFSLYHDSAFHLYSSYVAQKMISEMHAGYIDNMPEGPWIKRNPYGVIFTEEVEGDNSLTFDDTSRSSSKQEEEMEEEACEFSKKEEFLKKIKFDSEVQAKLNNMIHKSQGQGMKKKKDDQK